MMGIARSHVRCTVCGHLTAMAEADAAATLTCARCGATDTDLAAVALVPCPEDDAGAIQACRASEHDPALGAHVVEVD